MMRPSNQDVLSYANAMSTAGFALAVHGSTRLDTTAGLSEVSIGRVLDLFDGPLARYTGQASSFGAIVDSTYDKLAGLSIVAGEWRKDIAPKAALKSIVGINIFNSIVTAVAMKRNPDQGLSATKNGKYAMALQNFALGSYALANILTETAPTSSRNIRRAGNLATVLGVGWFGFRAGLDYVERTR